MTDPIYFYGKNCEYGFLSNFATYGFQAELYHNNLYWKTSEHFYQAAKFYGNPHWIHRICEAGTPAAAKRMGRANSSSIKVRYDWDIVRIQAMEVAIYSKFSQNEDIKQHLMATGNAKLIENSPTDYFWGCGADKTGVNKLGELLMKLRDQFTMEAVNQRSRYVES